MWAARTGRLDLVQAILDAGATVNLTDNSGETALTIAAKKRRISVVERLVARGASADAHRIEAPVPPPRAAVAKGLPLVQRVAAAWSDHMKCFSCHHQVMSVLVTSMAHAHGFAVDESMAAVQSGQIRAGPEMFSRVFGPALESDRTLLQAELSYGNDATFSIAGALYMGIEIGDRRTAAHETTALALARSQTKDGRWRAGAPRVLMESSDFTSTAWAVRAIQKYGPAAYANEIRDRLERAKQWLLATAATTTDDKAYRLLGLKWAGATNAQVQTPATAKELPTDYRASSRP